MHQLDEHDYTESHLYIRINISIHISQLKYFFFSRSIDLYKFLSCLPIE